MKILILSVCIYIEFSRENRTFFSSVVRDPSLERRKIRRRRKKGKQAEEKEEEEEQEEEACDD